MAAKKAKGLGELIRYWVLQIELATCMYVMDPIEKMIFRILANLLCSARSEFSF